jgi:alpha-L-rhamnosidase
VGRYFYGKTPALLAQLELEYADGTSEVIGTGPDWKVSGEGPTREADALMGEAYDAGKEQAGWSKPGFAANGWDPAILATDNGSTKAKFFDSAGQREVELGFTEPARLETYPGPPVRATQELKPVRITEPQPGTYIFDLGQNFAGIARLKVKGPAGTKVRLRFGEMLHPDGRLMTENLRRARATDTYILRGDPAGETWQPRFTYHGFQYVEVTGYPGKPGLDAITGVVIHSDTPLTSKFECSDPVVNRVYQNAVWTQRANFVELPTDCPQRDERLGWMGDAQIYVRAATYHADVASFFNKWLREVEEAQLPNGAYPDYAPYPMFHGGPDGYGTAWTDAGIICPYTLWKVTGDTRFVEAHYPSMLSFLEFRRKRAPDFRGKASGNNWGDWLSLGEQTPIELVDAAYFAQSARMMAEIAEALRWREDADRHWKLFEDIRRVFQADYLNPDGTLKVDTQTAYALALYFNLIPENLRQAAGDRLAAKIEANGGRMATGFLGTRHLLPVLTATGHQDLAVRMLQSRDFPSWGYEVANGATSIWERWNSFTNEKGFGDAAMNSFSHYSFGAVTEWMFESLAGIETDGPGFQHISIHPGPPKPGTNPLHKPIDHVRAEYDSIQGRITSEWWVKDGRFELDVVIPANCRATIHVPADPGTVTVEGLDLPKELRKRPYLRDDAVFQVEAGRYRFTSKWATK